MLLFDNMQSHYETPLLKLEDNHMMVLETAHRLSTCFTFSKSKTSSPDCAGKVLSEIVESLCQLVEGLCARLTQYTVLEMAEYLGSRCIQSAYIRVIR